MDRFLNIILTMCTIVISGILGWNTQVNEAAQAHSAKVESFNQVVDLLFTHCEPQMESLLYSFAWELTDAERDKARASNIMSLLSGDDDLDNPDKWINTADQIVTAYQLQCDMEDDDEFMQMAIQEPMVDDIITEAPFTGGTRGLSVPDDRVQAPIQQQQTYQADYSPDEWQLQQSSDTARLRSKETQYAESKIASKTRETAHHAVLASYKAGGAGDEADYAVERLALIKKQLAEAGVDKVPRIYLTQISSHYAICLSGGAWDMTDARKWVSLARETGIAPDAFVQSEKSWVECDDADTVEGLRSCKG